MRSEVRNARRAVIGGLRVVSVGVGWVRSAGAAIPARALSRCCALAGRASVAPRMTSEIRRVAGECGNRTHPTLRSRVTVILKITEATRLHPPPIVSLNFDRNLSPSGDFSDYCRPSDP